MEKQLNELRDDVREIKSALIGNKAMGQKGLVHKVECHAKYIAEDRKTKQKAIGIFVGLQLAWAGFLAWFKLKG